MSYKIRPKRSITPGAVPSANVLDIGELAINLSDQRLFTKDGSNSVIALGGGVGDVQSANTLYVGNLIPKADQTYNLGAPGNSWLSLYISANTIFLGNTALRSDGFGGLITLEVNPETGNILSETPVPINTGNIVEGANLFFTNIRAIGALTGGSGITIEANGLVVATESQVISTGSQVETPSTNSIILDRTVNVASDIFVIVNGLIQIPATDYTVSGNVLTLLADVPSNSTVEVRYIFL